MRDEIKYIRTLVRLSGKKGKVRIHVRGCSYEPSCTSKPCKNPQQKDYLITTEKRPQPSKTSAYAVIKPCEKHFSVWITGSPFSGWEVL